MLTLVTGVVLRVAALCTCLVSFRHYNFFQRDCSHHCLLFARIDIKDKFLDEINPWSCQTIYLGYVVCFICSICEVAFRKMS